MRTAGSASSSGGERMAAYSWRCPICGGCLRENPGALPLGKTVHRLADCRRVCDACEIGLSNARDKVTFVRSRWETGLWNPDSASRLRLACKQRLHGSSREGMLERLARERSEDLLTWNVFEHLEHRKRLALFVSHVTGQPCSQEPRILFWGWNDPLPDIRRQAEEVLEQELGESYQSRTEPDVMLVTDRHVLLVEAKFGSANEQKSDRVGHYIAATKGAFTPEAARSSRDHYQLIRNWALGWRLAELRRAQPWLVNLVCDQEEAEVESTFRGFITTPGHFVRRTWEGLVPSVSQTLAPLLARATQYFAPAFPSIGSPPSTEA